MDGKCINAIQSLPSLVCTHHSLLIPGCSDFDYNFASLGTPRMRLRTHAAWARDGDGPREFRCTNHFIEFHCKQKIIQYKEKYLEWRTIGYSPQFIGIDWQPLVGVNLKAKSNRWRSSVEGTAALANHFINLQQCKFPRCMYTANAAWIFFSNCPKC